MPQTNNDNSISDRVLIALRQIIRSIDIRSKRLVKQFGLTGPQLLILQEIAATGEITASELAKAISLSQATVTGILERLEKRNLIARRRSNSDRRRVKVSTTTTGRRLLEAAPPLMQESFLEQFDRLQNWEQHMILSTLQRLVAMMDAKQIEAAPILASEPLEALPDTPNELSSGIET
ncbi:MAG: MarR family winged helix-turn-helix transcriptional regulator [Desulfobacterales bacterium]|nr:MarR family winged helix-turn-helix transcriptional regulator [Desulfobacterales bacterium]